jgi:C4-type Zn-finger protein
MFSQVQCPRCKVTGQVIQLPFIPGRGYDPKMTYHKCQVCGYKFYDIPKAKIKGE